jgi:hypothetical protein
MLRMRTLQEIVRKGQNENGKEGKETAWLAGGRGDEGFLASLAHASSVMISNQTAKGIMKD